MLIKNTTREILQYALGVTSRQYNGNIVFRECELKRHTRNGAEVWKVNLTVKSKPWRGSANENTRQIAERGMHFNGDKHDTKECGKVWSKCAERYDNSGVVRKERYYGNGSVKYIAAACWHAHGLFFDALNGDAVLQTKCYSGRADQYGWRQGEGDRNAGSQFMPEMMSEQCDCQSNPPKPERHMPQVVKATRKLSGDKTFPTPRQLSNLAIDQDGNIVTKTQIVQSQHLNAFNAVMAELPTLEEYAKEWKRK